jgi:hypothetical protein
MDDDPLVDRLRRENTLLRSRYEIAAWHADLHAHAAQQAIRERDAALAAAATHEVGAGGLRWQRRRRVDQGGEPVAVDTTGYPVVIISRDRLDCLAELVAWLESADGIGQIHIVDNASTWPPLVDYLDRSPHTVHRLGANLGHLAPLVTGLISEISTTPFIVSDPDVIPSDECPTDVVAHLAQILKRHPELDKVGLGLRLDDLPEQFEHRQAVLTWEAKYWQVELEPGVYAADVDTTFALYRPGRDHKTFRAGRTGAPYTARHLPWYADSGNPTEEDRYYREHADPAVASWSGGALPVLYRDGADPTEAPDAV